MAGACQMHIYPLEFVERLNMKRGLLLGIILALVVFISPAWAENVDSIQWMRGDYIGVGGIDIQKFSQRKIYQELMAFFETDSGVKQALAEIRDAGVVLDKTLKRIVVGIPVDVEKSEHIVFWETDEDLSKYRAILSAHSNKIDTRTFMEVPYYATKRENECMALIENVFVLGSELRVKEVIESYKTGYKKGLKSAELAAEVKRTDKSRDAWFAFALTARERQRIGGGDPIIDMTSEGLGKANLGDIQQGNISMAFSSGLLVLSTTRMASEQSAKQTATLLTTLIERGANDKDIAELGLGAFLTGVSFSSKKDELLLTVTYDQARFDELIALITQFAKSIPGQPKTKKSAPAPTARPAAK